MSMIAPQGIIPALLLQRSKRAAVLAWLRTAPYPSSFRRGLLAGWADLVGLSLTPDEYLFVGRGTYPFTLADASESPNTRGVENGQ